MRSHVDKSKVSCNTCFAFVMEHRLLTEIRKFSKQAFRLFMNDIEVLQCEHWIIRSSYDDDSALLN
jgi:hypothetical protein